MPAIGKGRHIDRKRTAKSTGSGGVDLGKLRKGCSIGCRYGTVQGSNLWVFSY